MRRAYLSMQIYVDHVLFSFIIVFTISLIMHGSIDEMDS